MTETDRTFTHDETVKLRSKPEVKGKIMAINQVNGIPVSAVLYGWGERFFEELAHEDEALENDPPVPTEVHGTMSADGTFVAD